MLNLFAQARNKATEHRTHRTHTEERIMDRYIPRTLSSHSYRSRPEPTEALDDSILNFTGTAINEGSRALGSAPQLKISEANSLPVERQSEAIRELLEFQAVGRVFNFRPETPKLRGASASGFSLLTPVSGSGACSTPSGSSSLQFSRVSGSFASASTARTSFDCDISSMVSTPVKRKNTAASRTPLRVLDAPSLTNDFYTNVVSWSTLTGRIAVGLASDVYLWREDEIATLLEVPRGHSISVVSFSMGDYIVIATKEGNFFLFSQSPESRTLLYEYDNSGKGICCLTWCPHRPNAFFAGDDSGSVLYFEISDTKKLELVSKFKCHQQQVCGIAVGYDGSQISVGGNDNCCTIWDITDINNPQHMFHLSHQAAVKAIAYCPWSKALLATGGGSKDRTIRFWHTKSGTLLKSIQTNGQITSLIWSTKKKQITLTSGFGDPKESKLISVYSYPVMEELVQVDATPGLRALSAVLSPDSCGICVATNDETVRFYQIWNPDDCVIKESQEGSIFGSDLIDLCEGITKTGGSIR